MPAWGAAGTLTLVSGVITAIALSSGGFGYQNAPTVAVVDESGTGATVTATVAKGKVTAFTVGAGGTGYTAPRLVVTGGAGDDSDIKLVRDADVEGAQETALFNTNQDLFDSEGAWFRAFNLLTAHYLVEILLAAGEGLASQYNWLTSSKKVGDVAEAYSIPKRIMEDMTLATFSKTRYGALYLSIIGPLIIGNMQTNFRRTPP